MSFGDVAERAAAYAARIMTLERQLGECSGAVQTLSKEAGQLRAALAYAIEEADRWHDECRGEPVDTPRMDAARALLRE